MIFVGTASRFSLVSSEGPLGTAQTSTRVAFKPEIEVQTSSGMLLDDKSSGPL
jgi:hypothetical protein